MNKFRYKFEINHLFSYTTITTKISGKCEIKHNKTKSFIIPQNIALKNYIFKNFTVFLKE